MTTTLYILIAYLIGLIAGGVLGAKIMRLFWLSKHPEDEITGEAVAHVEWGGDPLTITNCKFKNNDSGDARAQDLGS